MSFLLGARTHHGAVAPSSPKKTHDCFAFGFRFAFANSAAKQRVTTFLFVLVRVPYRLKKTRGRTAFFGRSMGLSPTSTQRVRRDARRASDSLEAGKLGEGFDNASQPGGCPELRSGRIEDSWRTALCRPGRLCRRRRLGRFASALLTTLFR